MRKRRAVNTNNIVIVCEGTDTEVRYLTDFAHYIDQNFPGRFSDIRIVPTAQELVVATKRNQRKRKLKQDDYWGYYLQTEETKEDYERYRAQPTRYVREAELFLKDGSYCEAWAVYDHDNFPAHEDASNHAKEASVKIAFSSISFEEWILLHFERNDHVFSRSVCKCHKKDMLCGSGKAPDDCHGTKCVAGRLRERLYIPHYGKTMEGLFELLFPLHKIAFINAKWIKDLHHDKKQWECNPFTSVDSLVKRLLGYEQSYTWMGIDGVCRIGRTALQLTGYEVKNIGDNDIVFEYELYDSQMNRIASANSGLLAPAGYVSLELPEAAHYIGIKDRGDIVIACLG